MFCFLCRIILFHQGGENPSLHSVSFGSGATPHSVVFQTPNPLAAFRDGTGMRCIRDGTEVDGMSTGMRSVRDGTPMMRDSLSLHDGSTQGIKAMDAMIRIHVKASLAELPEPQNVIEVALPESIGGPEDELMAVPDLEEDAEDRQKRKEIEEMKQREIERRRQTQVIQQELPRPLFPEKVIFETSKYAQLRGAGAQYLNTAEELLYDEMVSIFSFHWLHFLSSRLYSFRIR